MTQAKGGPGRTRAAKPPAQAAADEHDPKVQTVTADFHGLELTLPPKLPGSMALRLGKMQSAPAAAGPGAMYEFLVGLIGADQVDRVMDHLDALGWDYDDFDRTVGELLAAVTGAYGGEPGESKASPGS